MSGTNNQPSTTEAGTGEMGGRVEGKQQPEQKKATTSALSEREGAATARQQPALSATPAPLPSFIQGSSKDQPVERSPVRQMSTPSSVNTPEGSRPLAPVRHPEQIVPGSQSSRTTTAAVPSEQRARTDIQPQPFQRWANLRSWAIARIPHFTCPSLCPRPLRILQLQLGVLPPCHCPHKGTPDRNKTPLEADLVLQRHLQLGHSRTPASLSYGITPPPDPTKPYTFPGSTAPSHTPRRSKPLVPTTIFHTSTHFRHLRVR
ncbi:hypothetical protein NLJ89_g8118 [Agrocybe chaxingu]|uniref:Uncharacterized protein n=1 Tax=Agrocybe chaxingu TaxID=84603 RepID=A0A9W8JT82_9AGAR|nr:hypothetical protein NLJ89_g8118 [Agrocybe chaxingu]